MRISKKARPIRASGIKVSVAKDGKFTVTNARNSFSKTYTSRLRCERAIPLQSTLHKLVWPSGSRRIHSSLLDEEPGLSPRSFRRTAGDRDLQHLVRTDSLQRPSSAQIAERVKRGVYEAGGFPLEFPVMSLGETNIRPTAMLFRNLASMDVEESIRGNPIDGVVLLCGCDKTTPSLVMGAASCDLPALVVSGGPMLNGNFRGQAIGSGTAVWQMSEDVRGGQDEARRFHGRGIVHVALGRPLHDHGNRFHDGLHGGGAGHGHAAERGDSGRRFAPLRAGATGRDGASWRWCMRT